jgi:hypothetical protein
VKRRIDEEHKSFIREINKIIQTGEMVALQSMKGVTGTDLMKELDSHCKTGTFLFSACYGYVLQCT